MGFTRTFIAFDTPSAIRKDMEDLQHDLRDSQAEVRWESSDKFHVTIKFLGDVDDTQLAFVLNDIKSISQEHHQFEVTYSGLGGFPTIRHPRVIWIGCENDDGRLEQLKRALDIGLAPRGFEIETRPFKPHITLGRVKSENGIRNLTPMLENRMFEPRTAHIDEIIVMKSVLQPIGAEYIVLETIRLQS